MIHLRTAQPVDLVPGPIPPPWIAQVPPVVMPSVTAGPVASPEARRQAGNGAGRPLKDRPPVPRPQDSPDPPPAHERPSRDRSAGHPPPGFPDPCATFDDFRRGACHAFLDHLFR
jgi:hypothetical protein